MTYKIDSRIEGTYLVYEAPLPTGQGVASGVVVQKYERASGNVWTCENHERKSNCMHIELAQKHLEGE